MNHLDPLSGDQEERNSSLRGHAQQGRKEDATGQNAVSDENKGPQAHQDDVIGGQTQQGYVIGRQTQEDVSEQSPKPETYSRAHALDGDITWQKTQQDDVREQQTLQDGTEGRQAARKDEKAPQIEQDDAKGLETGQNEAKGHQIQQDDVKGQRTGQNEEKGQQVQRDDVNGQKTRQNEAKEQQIQQDGVKGQQTLQDGVTGQQEEQDDVKRQEPHGDIIRKPIERQIQENNVTGQQKVDVSKHQTQERDVTMKQEDENEVKGRQAQEDDVAEQRTHPVTTVSSADDSGGDEGEGAGGERRFTIQQVAQRNEQAGWLEWLPYRCRVYDCTGFKPHIQRYILGRRSEQNAAFAAFDALVDSTKPPPQQWPAYYESDEDKEANSDDEKDEDEEDDTAAPASHDQVSGDRVEVSRGESEEENERWQSEEEKEQWEEKTGRVVSEDGQLQHNGKTITLRPSRWEYVIRGQYGCWILREKQWSWRRRSGSYEYAFTGVPVDITSPEVWKGLSRYPGSYVTPLMDVLREYGLTCEEISRELEPFLLGRLTTSLKALKAYRNEVRAHMAEIIGNLETELGRDKKSEVPDGWLGHWEHLGFARKSFWSLRDWDEEEWDKFYKLHDKRLLQFLWHFEGRLAEGDPQGPGDGDPNLRPFPLHVDPDSLKYWLREWEPFDTEVPADGAWYRLGLLEADHRDPHQMFAATLRPDRPDLHLGQVQLTFAIEGEAAWDTLPEDVVLKEVMTPEQQQLQAARERRTDLHDLKRMRRRRERLAEYFIDVHDLAPAVVLPFLKWASLMEKSESDFQALCDRQ